MSKSSRDASDDLLGRLGVRPIVNAVGYATRVAGSCPHPEVIAAMTAASSRYFEIDDLLAAAGRVIQQATGAESGIITAGAGAALTLAAAAVLAGNDPEIMDRLPDTSLCARDEIVFPIPGPFDYDHALRLAGAKLVLVDYRAADALARIERAIGPRTAAIGWVWLGVDERPNLDEVIAIARRRGLPVIVDAAFAMPPVENLTAFSRRDADLIAYSGGKHIGGPQASGVLCGREELIRSAWVQMVDMDVRSGTWSLRHWVEAGWIARPPRHGVGRQMKVSKESILGLMTALERYRLRDHAAERAAWGAAIDEIFAGVDSLEELRCERFEHATNGQPYPLVRIESGSMRVRELLLALRERAKRIVLAEDEVSPDRAFIHPQCLVPGDAAEIVAAIREAVAEHRTRGAR